MPQEQNTGKPFWVSKQRFPAQDLQPRVRNRAESLILVLIGSEFELPMKRLRITGISMQTITSRMGLPVRRAFMMPKFKPEDICCCTSDRSMAPSRNAFASGASGTSSWANWLRTWSTNRWSHPTISPWVGATTIQHLIYIQLSPPKRQVLSMLPLDPHGRCCSSTLRFSFNLLGRRPMVYQGLSPFSSSFPIQILDILAASTQNTSPEGSLDHGALFRFQRTETGFCMFNQSLLQRGKSETTWSPWRHRRVGPPGPSLRDLCTDHVHQQVHHTSGLDSARMKRNGSHKQPGMMHQYAPVISKSKKSIDAGQKAILYLNNCCCWFFPHLKNHQNVSTIKSIDHKKKHQQCKANLGSPQKQDVYSSSLVVSPFFER